VIPSVLAALEINKALQHLDMSYLAITDVGGEELGRNLKAANLETLHLKGNEIGDKSAQSIVEALATKAHISYLSIGSKISDAGIAELSEIIGRDLTSIRILDLTKNNFTDSGCSSIAGMIYSSERLAGLYLSENALSEKCLDTILESMQCEGGWFGNKNLRLLGLSETNLTASSAKKIATYLECNIGLTILDLSDNNLTDAGAGSIASVLPRNRYLQHLSLSKCGITDHVMKTIAWWIKNSIRRTGGILDDEAAQFYSGNDFLSLFLDGNSIGDTGAELLANVLKKNHVLQHVSLSWNKISDVGAIKILEMLKENRALREVSLIENPISEPLLREIQAELQGREYDEEETEIFENEEGGGGFPLVVVFLLVGGYLWTRRR